MCISPVKLSMQSVAFKGSNKWCIATRLHLSVYEIATHFLMNFFVSYYFDGNESTHLRQLNEHRDSRAHF